MLRNRLVILVMKRFTLLNSNNNNSSPKTTVNKSSNEINKEQPSVDIVDLEYYITHHQYDCINAIHYAIIKRCTGIICDSRKSRVPRISRSLYSLIFNSSHNASPPSLTFNDSFALILSSLVSNYSGATINDAISDFTHSLLVDDNFNTHHGFQQALLMFLRVVLTNAHEVLYYNPTSFGVEEFILMLKGILLKDDITPTEITPEFIVVKSVEEFTKRTAYYKSKMSRNIIIGQAQQQQSGDPSFDPKEFVKFHETHTIAFESTTTINSTTRFYKQPVHSDCLYKLDDDESVIPKHQEKQQEQPKAQSVLPREQEIIPKEKSRLEKRLHQLQYKGY